MSKELTLKTFGASVVVGLAAIVIWGLMSRRKRATAGAKSILSDALPLAERLPPILNYIYNVQSDEEGKSSVGALFLRYFGPRFFDPTKFVEDKSAIVLTKSSGYIGATVLEGLGMKRAASSGAGTDKQSSRAEAVEYRDDLTLPSELIEEVLASVPKSCVRQAFETAELYFDLCKKRKSDASDAVTHSEETYNSLLAQLWDVSFNSALDAPSNQPLFSREGDGWSELGFQGKDPVTDLRGGGITALEDYLAFAEGNSELHAAMIHFNREEHAKKGTAWFLEACVSIQLTVQLTTSVNDAASPSTVGASSGHSGGRLLKKRETSSTPAGSPLRFTTPVMTYLYEGPPHEMRKRLQRLHGLYFKAFFTLWSRERPFIMEYQSFMDKTFYPESPSLVEQYLAERE